MPCMTTPDVDVLLANANGWLAEDPDDRTRAELADLVSRIEADASGGSPGDVADLADRFRGTLEFGTAGLRGALGAGPNRMNRIVVIRAAAGLAAYLTDKRAAPGSTVVDRLRRAPQLRRLRPGHRRSDERRRTDSAGAAATAPDPVAGLRRSASSAASPASW